MLEGRTPGSVADQQQFELRVALSNAREGLEQNTLAFLWHHAAGAGQIGTRRTARAQPQPSKLSKIDTIGHDRGAFDPPGNRCGDGEASMTGAVLDLEQGPHGGRQ